MTATDHDTRRHRDTETLFEFSLGGSVSRCVVALNVRRIATWAAIFLLVTSPAHADEIKVMTSGAFTEAYQQLVQQFQKTTRHTVVTTFGASLGGAKDSIPARLARGEPVDVVI